MVPAALLVPICGAMLGKDDTRLILSLIESLLKAKDPVGYAGAMELLDTFKDFSNKLPDEKGKINLELQSNPGAVEKLKQQMSENIRSRVNVKDKEGGQ